MKTNCTPANKLEDKTYLPDRVDELERRLKAVSERLEWASEQLEQFTAVIDFDVWKGEQEGPCRPDDTIYVVHGYVLNVKGSHNVDLLHASTDGKAAHEVARNYSENFFRKGGCALMLYNYTTVSTVVNGRPDGIPDRY